MVFLIAGLYNRSIPRIIYDDVEKEWRINKHDSEHEIQQNKLGNWMFLFIDLIFVAVVSKCAIIMENCNTSLHTIMFCNTILAVMFITRLHIDDYCNRFYVNDVFHRILYFIYAMTMFVFGLNVNVLNTAGAHDDILCAANIYGYGFGMAFFTSRIIIIMLYGSVITSDETGLAKTQFALEIVRSALSAFISVCLTTAVNEVRLFEATYRMNIYLVCCFLEFCFHAGHSIALSYKSSLLDQPNRSYLWKYIVAEEAYPLDIEVYEERMGAFIMLVLGEVMITTLVQYRDPTIDQGETYKFNVLSCVVIFLYGILYYDSTRPITKLDTGHIEEYSAHVAESSIEITHMHEKHSDEASQHQERGQGHDGHEHIHAMTHSILTSFIYTWIHLVVALSMFYTTAAIGIIYAKEAHANEAGHRRLGGASLEATDDNDISPYHKTFFSDRFLLASSIAFSLICLAIINALHKGFSQLCLKGRAQHSFILKFFIACLHFIVPVLPIKNGSTLCFVHGILLLVSLCFDIKILSKAQIAVVQRLYLETELKSQSELLTRTRTGTKNDIVLGHSKGDASNQSDAVTTKQLGGSVPLQSEDVSRSSRSLFSQQRRTSLSNAGVGSPLATRPLDAQNPSRSSAPTTPNRESTMNPMAESSKSNSISSNPNFIEPRKQPKSPEPPNLPMRRSSMASVRPNAAGVTSSIASAQAASPLANSGVRSVMQRRLSVQVSANAQREI